MCYLEYFLYIRALFLWDRRALPSVRSSARPTLDVA